MAKEKENLIEPVSSEKIRFQLWMKPSTQELADEMWKKANCSCKGDFIEKAIIFYGMAHNGLGRRTIHSKEQIIAERRTII